MILLDTNALIWLLTGHQRAEALSSASARLALSPVSLLELQFLVEVGRIQLAPSESIATISADRRWRMDNPSASALFEAAHLLAWTRDPFDRLLAAHARLRRWRLATGDRQLLSHLGPDATIAL